MAVVFVDVFFIYNFIVNLILLITTKLLCFSKTKMPNILLGALLGSGYAVAVMTLSISGIKSYILNLAVVAAMIVVSFKIKKLKIFFKTAAVFLIATFVYAGAMMFLILFMHTGIYFGGGIFYVDISVLSILCAASAVYGCIYFFKRMLQKNITQEKFVYDLYLEKNGISVSVKAIYDSANSLFEPISGLPVILIEESKVELFNINTYRIVPFKGAGASGVIMAFLPEKVKIDGTELEKEVYVGCYNKKFSVTDSYNALLHPFAMPDKIKVKCDNFSERLR